MGGITILWISLAENRSMFTEANAPLLELLRVQAKVIDIETTDQALSLLTHENPMTAVPIKAIVLSDSAIVEPKNKELLTKLVEYVKSGGILVFACQFSALVKGSKLTAMFTNTWDLPWRSGPRTSNKLVLNTAVIGLDCTNIPETYTTETHLLSEVLRHQSVYVPISKTSIENTIPSRKLIMPMDLACEKSGAAFAAIGRGWLGYIGDVRCSMESSRLVVAMCMTESPPVRTPTTGHNSVQVRE